MKYFRLSMVLVCIGITGQGCGRDRRPARPHESEAELQIVGFPIIPLRSALIADTSLLRSPLAISAGAGFVAVADSRTDSALVIFDASSGAFVGELGSRYVDSVLVVPMMLTGPPTGNDGFKAYDPISHVTLTFGVGKSVTVRGATTLSAEASIIQPLYLPNGTFFSTGLRLPTRFGLFRGDGRLLAARGPKPPGSDTLAIFVRQQANSARGTMSADHERLAFAGRYSDKLEIYDTLGHLLATGTRPFKFDPVYEVGQRAGAPALGMVPGSRIGFVNITADSVYIYGLFSGRTIGGSAAQAYDGEDVYQYRWNGQLGCVFRLDQYVTAITVTADGRYIYALTPGSRPKLIRYELRACNIRQASNVVRRGEAHHDG